MEVLSNIASGKAHGKIILIGEHAVVHNQPAIAIPFTSATVEVTIEELFGETTIESIYHTGKMKDAPKKLKNLFETLKAVCDYFDVTTENLHITINSNIPAERGMGSSAAVATALVRALFHAFDKELPDELLHRFVAISENIAHGNPSGLDAKVVSSNDSIFYVKNKKAEFFNMDLPGYLVVADTGEQGATGEAVIDVGQLVANRKTGAKQRITELGDLANQARRFIETKDLGRLGEILEKAHQNLQKLTVSNEKLDALVQTAKENGALGAKLTGGGRGGCMISLTDKAEHAQELATAFLEAGATKTWIHPLGANINVK
jgi:mevalonate kinase